MAREGHDRLGDEPVWIGGEILGDALEVALLGVCADHDAVAAVPVARLDDELAQLGYLRASVDRTGRHRPDQRLLAAVEADAVLDHSVDELVVGEAAPEAVDKTDPPLQPRV